MSNPTGNLKEDIEKMIRLELIENKIYKNKFEWMLDDIRIEKIISSQFRPSKIFFWGFSSTRS